MNKYDAGSINIDNLTIRVPAGWQGDPVFLARKISEQIQNQAIDMYSVKQMSFTVQGYYAGIHANGAADDFSLQLSKQLSDKAINEANNGGRR